MFILPAAFSPKNITRRKFINKPLAIGKKMVIPFILPGKANDRISRLCPCRKFNRAVKDDRVEIIEIEATVIVILPHNRFKKANIKSLCDIIAQVMIGHIFCAVGAFSRDFWPHIPQETSRCWCILFSRKWCSA